MINYTPKRIISLTSGAGWWAEHGSGGHVIYEPIAVFALLEVAVEDQVKQVIVPLMDWEIDHLNERIVREITMPSALGHTLYHETDFSSLGRELKHPHDRRPK